MAKMGYILAAKSNFLHSLQKKGYGYVQYSDAGAGVFVYRICAAESMPLTNRENLTSFFKVKTAVFPHFLKSSYRITGRMFL